MKQQTVFGRFAKTVVGLASSAFLLSVSCAGGVCSESAVTLEGTAVGVNDVAADDAHGRRHLAPSDSAFMLRPRERSFRQFERVSPHERGPRFADDAARIAMERMATRITIDNAGEHADSLRQKLVREIEEARRLPTASAAQQQEAEQ